MMLLRKSSRDGSLLILGALALTASLGARARAETAPGPVPAAPPSMPGAVPSAAPAVVPAMAAPAGMGMPMAPPAGTAPGVAASGSPAVPPAAAATSSPESPATPSSATPPTGDTAGGGGYTVRLRSLEKNVNELKEQIFRTKARLNLLKETVLGGTLGASRAVIRHKNEMGSSYRLIKAVYALDGVQIFSKADDSGRLAEMPEFDIYNGAIQPGSHTLTVMLVYQGNGFGVFSYLKGYKMTVHSSHTFVAGEAKATAINVVGYEKGNITTNLQDRPAVDFRINVVAVEAPGGTTSTSTANAATTK